MKFTYLKTLLNKYTFKVAKIKSFVESVCEGKTLNLFAGLIKLNIDEVRNDVRADMAADFHMDAFEYVNLVVNKTFDKYGTILLDPPYSYRKGMEMYGGKMTSQFNKLKDVLPKILNPKGIVITLGYHSVSMGKVRGFEVEHICLMSHGGAIHDTIITVERSRI